jgi:transposase
MYKSKYRPSFKRKLAQLYLEEMSSRQVASKFNVGHKQIRYWGQVFKIHREKAFEGGVANPSSTHKLSMLRAMWTNEWSLVHTSARFNLSSPGILSKWLADYTALGEEGLRPKRQGRSMKKQPRVASSKPSEEMTDKELRDELEYLRAENAVLKKLEALAQQKCVLAKKKR